ncbi:MAG: hypothetical protein KDI51_02920 [Xanthomonadales bacterium]|nr:hypothetical protein [Xanthomonadales bacterium]MCB1633511.1 hypothetical protein [Xanthomonadales bacterium]
MRKILLIINLNSLLITALSILSTWLCIRWNIRANFPLTLIATAVIFPIVFSISGAYKRRETALANYAQLKALGQALYLAARDWLTDPPPSTLTRARDSLGRLLAAVRVLLAADASQLRQHEAAVYASFAELSRFVREELRERGLVANEVSRCNQYLARMMVAFENCKHIYQYRTPRTLRAFSTVFICLLPILYGPYFAAAAADYAPQVSYAMPVLFSLVLVSLHNIQNHLENPFDGVGEDDISINVEAFLRRLD